MNIKDRLFDFAKCLIDTSKGAIRTAFNEEDDTVKTNKEASNFLKYKDKRLGRDIELYAFMNNVMGTSMMLTHLLRDIIYPIQNEKWSKEAKTYLNMWGVEVNEGENIGEWIKLFA